jgi:drug/metabolite transporter (DMT)-like permease
VSVARGLGALAILIPLWWWQEGGTVKFTARDIWIFAALGLGVLSNHLLTLFGLRHISAGAAGVIIGASPAIQAFLSSVLIRDVPFRLVWGGCAVSFAGVFLVVGLKGEAAAGEQPWLGATLVLLAQVSWALYSIGGRRTMERFSPLTVNWTTLSFSIFPQILLLGMDQRALTVGLGTVPLADWLVVGYLIVFATALGQQAWLYGVQGIGPSRAGVFVNLIPVSALVLSALLLGERIGLTEVAGIVMVLAGVWLVNRQSARQTH